jgi:hypothetical protein
MAETGSTRNTPASVVAFASQALGGVLVLLVTYWALASIPFRAIVLAYVAHVVGFGLTGAFVLVSLIVAGVGIRRRRPGLALSPLIFCLLWFAASVSHRVVLMQTGAVSAASGSLPTPSELAQASLILHREGFSSEFLKLLAEQRVQEVVEVPGGFRRATVGRATAHRRGAGCDGVEKVNTPVLKDAGRLDECFVVYPVDKEPDGIVLRIVHDAPGRQVGRFIVRRDGQERVVATWTSEARRTLSYVPVLGFGIDAFVSPKAGVWSNAPGGPFQIVYLGKAPFMLSDMIEAVAGVGLFGPIAPASVPANELVQRARRLLDRGNYAERLSAMKLVETARKLGYVDETSLLVAAATFGHMHYVVETPNDLRSFWYGLDDGRKRRVLDIVFARLSDPGLAAWRPSCEDVVPGPRHLVTEREAQAKTLFASRHDLGRWQYECALRFIVAARPRFDDDEYKRVQREMFRTLSGDGPSFPVKAMAFTTVFFLRRSEEIDFFSQRLALIPDDRLDWFIRHAGWHPPVRPDPGDSRIGSAVDAFRTAAKARIAAVPDDRLKRDLLSKFH